MCERGEIEERNLEPQKAEIPELITKVCTKCGERKPISEFGVRNDMKGGFSNECKECRNVRINATKPRSPEYLLKKEMASKGKKRCCNCRIFLDLSEFHSNRTERDGKNRMCKACVKIMGAKRKDKVNFKPIMYGEKVCATCHAMLPVSFFHHTKYSTDGLASSCKSCSSLAGKKKREQTNYPFDANSYKTCSGCFETKFAHAFYPCRYNKDGLSSLCRACDKKRVAKRRDSLSFEADPNSTKICRACGEEKKACCFFNNCRFTDGLYSYCKDCVKKREALLRKNNKFYVLKEALRSRLREILKKYKISKKLDEVAVFGFLGCTPDYFILHLVQQFYPNPDTGEMMTFDNYGSKGWHIDHVIPLSKVDLTDSKQLARVVHYSNLRPMWAKENIRKSAKLPENWNLQEWLEEIDYAA